MIGLKRLYLFDSNKVKLLGIIFRFLQMMSFLLLFYSIMRQGKRAAAPKKARFSKRKGVDNLSELPAEIALNILRHCDIKALVAIGQVSHLWKRYARIYRASCLFSSLSLSEDQSLWKLIFEEFIVIKGNQQEGEKINWKEREIQKYQSP